jgi:hypothetical protein
MPEPYVITGTITIADGADRAGIKVQAFDRDLPSLERRTGSAPQLLGEASTDAEGRFKITYILEQFQSGEGVSPFRGLREKNADLSFRVFDRTGRELKIRNIDALNRTLGPEQIFFNIPSLLENVSISIEAPPQLDASEYERLIVLIAPVIDDVPLFELSDEDVVFLSNELGLEQQADILQHIEWLRRSALLAQQSNLPIEAFYGWGRKDLPARLLELAGVPLKDLRSILSKLISLETVELSRALRAAVAETIIPARLSDQIDAIIRQLKRSAQISRTVTAQLIDSDTDRMLAGYPVTTFDRSNGEENLGLDISDKQGLFTFSFYVPSDLPQDAPARKFAFKAQTLDGEEIPEGALVEIKANFPETEIASVKIKIPKPQTPQLQEQLQQAQITSPELLTYFNDHEIKAFSDIRIKGGIARLPNLPQLAPDILRKLESLTDLDRLSLNVAVSTVLMEKQYDGVLAISDTPYSEFVNAVKDTHEELTELEAMKLHVMASAQTNFLNNLLVEMAANQANGFTNETLT